MADANSLQDVRYAPPRAHVDDVETQAAGPVLATRSQRLGAGLIDGGLAFAAMWVASKLTPWDPWAVKPDDSVWEPVVMDTLIGLALFAVVHGVLLARRGQTIGKLALRIRMTRPDGSAVSLFRLLGLRYGIGYALMVVPAIGSIWALVDCLMVFRSNRRCLHDLIADTIVVKA